MEVLEEEVVEVEVVQKEEVEIEVVVQKVMVRYMSGENVVGMYLRVEGKVVKE